MKVKLSVEIELTEEQMREYADEYGLDATVAAVASDLRDNVSGGLQDSLIGEFADITVKRSR
jgi:hypothetical protein